MQYSAALVYTIFCRRSAKENVKEKKKVKEVADTSNLKTASKS